MNFKKFNLFLSFLFLLIVNNSMNAETWCEKLTQDMERYEQGDYCVHAGNVMQHSVWVLRNVANWIYEKNKDKNVVWVEGLDLKKYNRVLILTAFLHDIGKCGDNVFGPCSSKTSHEVVGFNYLKESLFNKKSLYVSKILELNNFDFTKLFDEFGLGNDDLKLCAIAVKMHYGLGSVMQDGISESSIKIYLSDLKKTADEVKYSMNEDLVKICILISAADVKGFKPISYYFGILDESICKLCPKWIEGIGNGVSVSVDGWTEWEYETKGLQARKYILEYYEKHKLEYDNSINILKKNLSDLKTNLKQVVFKLEKLKDHLNHLNSNLLKVN